MSVRVCAGDQHQAVETLKSFEKKDSKVAVAAATNLSFLYNLVHMHILLLLSSVLSWPSFLRCSSFATCRARFQRLDVLVAEPRASEHRSNSILCQWFTVNTLPSR